MSNPMYTPPAGSSSSGNGTLILVLGILSIFCLPILGPVAWIMGNNALASGSIDPSQAGQVNAGRICGIVGTVILVLGVIYWTLIFAGVAHGIMSTPKSPTY